MWRAVLRSMYSSALKPLTSPAILVSKLVVSKCVIRPTPETPSTMFDQTVSTSLPMGVMKPMPVTATRRPLELDLTFTQLKIRTQRPRSHRHRVGKVASVFGHSVQPGFRRACEGPGPAAAGVGLRACPGRRPEARGACPGGTGRCAGEG